MRNTRHLGVRTVGLETTFRILDSQTKLSNVDDERTRFGISYSPSEVLEANPASEIRRIT